MPIFLLYYKGYVLHSQITVNDKVQKFAVTQQIKIRLNHYSIYKLQLTSFATTLYLCILTQAYPPRFKLRQILREKNNRSVTISSYLQFFPVSMPLLILQHQVPFLAPCFPFNIPKPAAATDMKTPRIITLLLQHHPQHFAFSNSCKEIKVLQRH